jgi:hypothetical protein
MLIWRLFKWFLVLVILIVLFIGFGLPLLANTEEGRTKLAEVLGKSLNRNVAIGGLDVGWFFSSLDVENFRIDNPEGFPEGHFLKAGRIQFDSALKELVGGRVEGGLRGSGLDVHIIRKDGRTNLDGFGKKGGKEPAPEGREPDAPDKPDTKEDKGPPGKPSSDTELDVYLELTDSRVTIEDLDKGEKLVLEGVGLSTRLTNREGAADASVKIRIRAIDRDELKVRNLEIDSRAKGDWLELEQLSATLPGEGTLKGTGRLRVQGGDEWTANLTASKVGIDKDMMPIVAALLPFASSAGGQVEGLIDADFQMKGNGLTWEAMKPTLDGTGKVALSNMELPQDSVLAQAAALAGRSGGALTLNNAGAEFGLKQGWMQFNRLSASGEKARYDFAGRVSLDGKLELTMDLMPLVKTFGGGKSYAKASEYVKELPLRIEGTTDKPKLKAPELKDMAKGAIEKGIGKGLGKLADKWGKR